MSEQRTGIVISNHAVVGNCTTGDGSFIEASICGDGEVMLCNYGKFGAATVFVKFEEFEQLVEELRKRRAAWEEQSAYNEQLLACHDECVDGEVE